MIKAMQGTCGELSSEEFKNHYFLKSELVSFCKSKNLSCSGSKKDLEKRIIQFLETGKCEDLKPAKTKNLTGQNLKQKREFASVDDFLNSKIEKNFVCSQVHRCYFEKVLGKSFSFNVQFQNWLKANSEKTFKDAVVAFKEIRERKKTQKMQIGEQFEYNTYIRDFFEDNEGKNLNDAIKCWNYKKQLCGSHKYSRSDLEILK